MDVIQDNIHLFLEVVPSRCKVSQESPRATSVNTTSQRWEDCVLGREQLFIIPQHNESVQYCQELLISQLCQYSSVQAGSDAITTYQTAASLKAPRTRTHTHVHAYTKILCSSSASFLTKRFSSSCLMQHCFFPSCSGVRICVCMLYN